MNNRKGFTTIAIVLAVAATILILPLIQPLLKLGGGSGDKSVQSKTHTIKVTPATTPDGKPVYIQDAKGNISPLMQTEESTDASDVQTTPPAPWYERLIMWFVHLGLLGLLLAIAFPGAFVAVVVWIRGRLTELNAQITAHKSDLVDLKTEAQRIVLSVDDGLSAFDGQIKAALALVESTLDPAVKASYQSIASSLTNAKTAFLSAMSKKQDGSTKLLVSKLQQTSPPQV